MPSLQILDRCRYPLAELVSLVLYLEVGAEVRSIRLVAMGLEQELEVLELVAQLEMEARQALVVLE